MTSFMFILSEYDGKNHKILPPKIFFDFNEALKALYIRLGRFMGMSEENVYEYIQNICVFDVPKDDRCFISYAEQKARVIASTFIGEDIIWHDWSIERIIIKTSIMQ